MPGYDDNAEGVGSASRQVYRGIRDDLEQRRLVPGQRLIEADLMERFGVGRNAVREAMQLLAARGVVDLTRHRSSSIRKLALDEAMEVLDVAEVVTGLIARTAAQKYKPAEHAEMMGKIRTELAETISEPVAFSRALRHFYRALMSIGANRELSRIGPALALHIIYSQFIFGNPQDVEVERYVAICDAVMSGDSYKAERAGFEHIEHLRRAVIAIVERQSQRDPSQRRPTRKRRLQAG